MGTDGFGGRGGRKDERLGGGWIGGDELAALCRLPGCSVMSFGGFGRDNSEDGVDVCGTGAGGGGKSSVDGVELVGCMFTFKGFRLCVRMGTDGTGGSGRKGKRLGGGWFGGDELAAESENKKFTHATLKSNTTNQNTKH